MSLSGISQWRETPQWALIHALKLLAQNEKSYVVLD
jgi:hypothetical protein